MANACLIALTGEMEEYTTQLELLALHGHPQRALRLLIEAQQRFLNLINNHNNCTNPCSLQLDAVVLVDDYVFEYSEGVSEWDDVRNVVFFTKEFTHVLTVADPANPPPPGFVFNLAQFLSNRKYERRKEVITNGITFTVTVKNDIARATCPHCNVFLGRTDKVGIYVETDPNINMDEWTSTMRQMIAEIKIEEINLIN